MPEPGGERQPVGLGLVVDDLIGQQDIVIKSIGETFAGFKGISGAADLGLYKDMQAAKGAWHEAGIALRDELRKEG